MCRSLGTVPGILGLLLPPFRPKSGPKSKIPGRILKSVCRFVGIALSVFGVVSFGLGADLGPKSTISGPILKSVLGPFSLAESGGTRGSSRCHYDLARMAQCDVNSRNDACARTGAASMSPRHKKAQPVYM